MQRQLKQQLLDLQNRYQELEEQNAPYRGWERLTEEDLRYASPFNLNTLGDVESAMELILKALETLKHQPDAEKTTVIQENNQQLSIFEGTPLQAA